MDIRSFDIPGVVTVEPTVFEDARGSFFESYHSRRYADAGIPFSFCQDNRSTSRRGVLRGLHYQIRRPQGHLITVTRGQIFDVGVDLRRDSPTFGAWLGFELTADPPVQLFLPPGVAHGFCVLSESAELWYKCTERYAADDEGGVLWSDPDLAIAWPIVDPITSERDRALPRFSDIPPKHLPNVGR